MPLVPPKGVPREKLPLSLKKTLARPIIEHNQAEYQALLQKHGVAPNSSLARKLANLPRQIKQEHSEPVVFPPGMPMPDVPTELVMVPAHRTLKGKLLKAVLTRNEYDLYCETWKEWLTAHPEYNSPEDLDDLGVVCMETVSELRLRLALMNNPKLDINDALNQSHRRKQKARENLTARRVDRVGTKANGGYGPNIAIMAGTVTIEQDAERKRRLQQDDLEIAGFLEGTVKRPPELVDPRNQDPRDRA